MKRGRYDRAMNIVPIWHGLFHFFGLKFSMRVLGRTFIPHGKGTAQIFDFNNCGFCFIRFDASGENKSFYRNYFHVTFQKESDDNVFSIELEKTQPYNRSYYDYTTDPDDSPTDSDDGNEPENDSDNETDETNGTEGSDETGGCGGTYEPEGRTLRLKVTVIGRNDTDDDSDGGILAFVQISGDIDGKKIIEKFNTLEITLKGIDDDSDGSTS